MIENENENDPLKRLFNDLFRSDLDSPAFLTLQDLQGIIFYCRENYDEWQDMKVVFQGEIDEETVMECDIEKALCDGEAGVLILGNSPSEVSNITLSELDVILESIQEEFKEDWMTINICCRTVIDDEEFPYPNVLETFIDEEENTLVLKV